jgi:hypothetical protein
VYKNRAQLIELARPVFEHFGGSVPTGVGGLTRGILRRLKRYGVVDSHIAQLPQGTMINIWTWKEKNNGD